MNVPARHPTSQSSPQEVVQKRRAAGKEGGHLGIFPKPPGSRKGFDAWIGLDRLRERAEKTFYAVRKMLRGRKRSGHRVEFRG